MTNIRSVLLVALLLPLIGLGGLWGVQQARATTGPVMRAEITGLDPRDLLHGHYLAFRFAITAPEPWSEIHETQKYFIPEKDARWLDRALREGKHRFSVDVRGAPSAPVFGELYIEDMPWRDFMRVNAAETPEE